MAGYRKLGRKTDLRMSILKNLTTELIVNGKVKTTVDRAKEVKKIADSLISDAVKEVDNFSSREILVSKAKIDKDGKKILTERTSKNDREYHGVTRELDTKEVQVDDASRLAARRNAMKWLNKSSSKDGEKVAPTNILFNDVARRYEDRQGGYTRIIPTGTRRGDSADMCVLELV